MASSSSSFRLLFRTPAGVVATLFTLITTFYAVWVFGTKFDPINEAAVSSVILILLSFFFFGFGLNLSRKHGLEISLRRSWLLFALAGFSNGIAESVWFYRESILQVDPYHSGASLFFVLYYPLLLAGVLTFPVATAERHKRSLFWLDLLIVMTTSFMALWYFLAAPMSLHAAEGMETIVAISYPVGGAFIFAAVVALILRDVQKVAWWTLFLLGCGMLCTVIADGFLAYFEISRIVYELKFLNILWILCMLFMLTAVAWQNVAGKVAEIDTPEPVGPSRRFLRWSLPYLATLVGVTLLALTVGSSSASSVHTWGILVGIVLLVGLVLLRQDRMLQENIRLYHEMENLATTDALTGIHNRHYAHQILKAEIQRAKRHSHSLSILMVDVDGFKQYNDRFGHLQGDLALRTVAQLLSTQLRATDLLGRFGGDEFLAILPETDQAGAGVVAGKMKRAIAGKSFEGISLGVSIGWAGFRRELSFEQMLEEADRDLYRKKSER